VAVKPARVFNPGEMTLFVDEPAAPHDNVAPLTGSISRDTRSRFNFSNKRNSRPGALA
jgi:hypothetical protein